jgi:LmbE family N-acetylglucosaminyl deacetylase
MVMGGKKRPAAAADLFRTWQTYVEHFAELYESGQHLPGFPDEVPESQTLPLHAGRHDIIICSPHPDDETLNGALPLRLKKGNTRILNLAMTLGSNPVRQEERKAELAAACRILGFDCQLVCEPSGFTNPTYGMAENDGAARQQRIDILVRHFKREMPALIICPHAKDGHPVHEEVHHLALAAARQHTQNEKRQVLVAETEFWHPMTEPNLLIGLTPATIARLIVALLCHRGEIARHPYHLNLPARLMDNVRRGREIKRSDAPEPRCTFMEIYRLSRLDRGRLQKMKKGMATTIPPEYDLTLNGLQAL